MATSANSFTLASGKDAANLQVLFSKMKNIYYNDAALTKTAIASGVELELELPVLSDGVSLNTGEPDKTEVKLTTGTIWASRADKGDSDISFQVASIAGDINDLFLKKKAAASIETCTVVGLDGIFVGESYSLDVKKVTGSLIMTDDNGETVLILPNVEMYAGLVVSDGDNPAYFNVSVTPKANTDGADIIILHKTSAG